MGSSFWAALKEWEIWRNDQDDLKDFKQHVLSAPTEDLTSLLDDWCKSVAWEGCDLSEALPRIDAMLKELSKRYELHGPYSSEGTQKHGPTSPKGCCK